MSFRLLNHQIYNSMSAPLNGWLVLVLQQLLSFKQIHSDSSWLPPSLIAWFYLVCHFSVPCLRQCAILHRAALAPLFFCQILSHKQILQKYLHLLDSQGSIFGHSKNLTSSINTIEGGNHFHQSIISWVRIEI